MKPTFRAGDRIIYAAATHPIEMSPEGDWVGVCPDDNVAMNDRTETRLRCPRCGRYADELN
jgi:hypothetical protein